MKLQARDPYKVKTDALRMATRKLETGCGECAQSYIDLARRHGATEAEIRKALVRPRPGLTTPSLFRSAGAKSAAAVATARLGSMGQSLTAPLPSPLPPNAPPNPKRPLTPDEVLLLKGSAPAVDPNEYGIDSGTTPGLGGMPTNFYIGEISCVNCICEPNGSCPTCPCLFNTGAANAAGPYHTYCYAGVAGPGSAPDGVGAYDWGYEQGNTAVAAWGSGPYKDYVYGQTIFCDVEPGYGGWGTGGSGSNQAYNLAVVNGFLSAVADSYLTPGLYMNTSNYNLLPSNPDFSHKVVFWVVGVVCGGLSICCAAVDNCSPCDTSCTTTKANVAANWSSNAKKACIGGNGAVLWQYWIGSCPTCCPSHSCYSCPGDFDYSNQDPYIGFNPVGCTAC